MANKFDNAIKNLVAARESFRLAAKDAMQEIFQEAFEKNPTLGTISWKQYTPYFNDGEPCVFQIYGDPYFSSGRDIEVDYENEGEEVDEDDAQYSDGYTNAPDEDTKISWGGYLYQLEDLPAVIADFDSLKQVSEFINHSEVDDFLQDTFGEGRIVVTYQDGKVVIDTHEYDHE